MQLMAVLYAEMVENRSFEFLEAYGDKNDYYVKADGGYAWSAYPNEEVVSMNVVMASSLCEENPHYMRVKTSVDNAGLVNKAYDGIYLEKEAEYILTFWARTVNYTGDFVIQIADGEKVYAVDEHYYVKPEWLYEHVDFYDNYPRTTKVFSGEYAAHPINGFNRDDANTLEGALSEAAFLTGVERNSDVVVLASYAPLFARVGYAQWSPDMIWFNGEKAYGTPSYHVQCMYSNNMGDVTLDTNGEEKDAAKEGTYYSLSFDSKKNEVIVKIVNSNATSVKLELELAEEWKNRQDYTMQLLTGDELFLVYSFLTVNFVSQNIV